MNINKKMKYKPLKIIMIILSVIVIFLLFQFFKPTWSPKIKAEKSISELRKVEINGRELEVMIRGDHKENPIVIFVHGGPCCSEIPYVRKYQNLLEQNFTIVHYDQRGSGKSYDFGTDYSDVYANTHVEDLTIMYKWRKLYLNINLQKQNRGHFIRSKNWGLLYEKIRTNKYEG